MSARVVHVAPQEKQTTAIIEYVSTVDDDTEPIVSRWRVVMRPQADFNDRHVGYRVWIQTNEMQPETEAEALADACQLIEQFTERRESLG